MTYLLARYHIAIKRILLAGCLLSTLVVLLLASNVMAQNRKPVSDLKIIIVGGGMAGLAATLEAYKAGAKVTLIEGEKTTGGNSAKATSGINGCQTQAQINNGIKDSIDLFFEDTTKAGHEENDYGLVDKLVHHSSDAIVFLSSMDLNLSEVSIGGGHSVPRTHAFPMPPGGALKPFGVTIMRTVFDKINKDRLRLEAENLTDRLQILLETRVESLITSPDDNRRVIGVRIKKAGQSTNLYGDAVILATGGFCNDHDPQTSLLREFAEDKLKHPTTNGPFADGSGMKMAREIGARLIDMRKIQIHPTGFVDPSDPKAKTKFLAAEALRGSGALLLNEKGERFANELTLRDKLTGEILDKCKLNEMTGTHTASILLNQQTVDKFGRPAFEFYWKKKNFFKVANNSDHLSEMMGYDPAVLRKTFAEHNEMQSGARTDPFGKAFFPVEYSSDEVLYIGSITPVLHYSMGGVKINDKAQVLHKSDDRPIKGLFAAGEVAGGIHGGNRLSGNSYLDCVVFGRIAGTTAVDLSAKL